MKPSVYDLHITQENDHWWFKGRRAIIAAVLRTLPLPHNAKILEAGCGSGGNLPLLAQFGQVDAFELEEKVRLVAQARGVAKVCEGHLPDAVPFADKQYDLICLFDVLEHIKDDRAALTTLHSLLNERGQLMLTVPAFPMLWGVHDVEHHHFRRYRKQALISLLQRCGYEVQFISYFNFWLFPVALLVRLFERFVSGLKSKAIGSSLPHPIANQLLYMVMASERFFMPYSILPFGLSVALVARKK